MTVEIKAPAFPESVADGVVSAWHKGPGDSVARDELLVEIETDKVVMEVVAPAPGVIEAIMVAEGETITSEAVLATLTAGAAVTQAPAAEVSTSGEADSGAAAGTTEAIPMGPAVRALLDEHGITLAQFLPSVRRKGWARQVPSRFLDIHGALQDFGLLDGGCRGFVFGDVVVAKVL